MSLNRKIKKIINFHISKDKMFKLDNFACSHTNNDGDFLFQMLDR